jgi:hypothetical protein
VKRVETPRFRHPRERVLRSAPQGQHIAHLLHAVRVIRVELECPLEVALSCRELATGDADLSQHPMTPAFLRVAINRRGCHREG